MSHERIKFLNALIVDVLECKKKMFLGEDQSKKKSKIIHLKHELFQEEIMLKKLQREWRKNHKISKVKQVTADSNSDSCDEFDSANENSVHMSRFWSLVKESKCKV